MSPTQGFFESDHDYRQRVARESNEKTIKDTTGSSPSQGFFESNADYQSRISKEATERSIERTSGSRPSQGLFENEASYRNRIERENNELTIKEATGRNPSQGFFESSENYRTRIRKEANEQVIEKASGHKPAQGMFEGNYEYRSRISHVAKEARLNDNAKPTSPRSDYSSNHGGTSSSSETGIMPVILTILTMSGIGIIASELIKHNQARIVESNSQQLSQRGIQSSDQPSAGRLNEVTRVQPTEESAMPERDSNNYTDNTNIHSVDVLGTWSGSYTCNQGLTALVLEVYSIDNSSEIRAVFSFSAHPSNPDIPSGRFNMAGSYSQQDNTIDLKGKDWIERPQGYETVDLSGAFRTINSDQIIQGRVTANTPGCSTFELKKIS